MLLHGESKHLTIRGCSQLTAYVSIVWYCLTVRHCAHWISCLLWYNICAVVCSVGVMCRVVWAQARQIKSDTLASFQKWNYCASPLATAWLKWTHLTAALSVDSACSSASDASEDEDSGSGFRIRKKRKHPTRLITVREMNTVWRSLSETKHMSHTLKM